MVLTETSMCQKNVGTATEVFAEYRDFIHMVIYSQVKNKSHADDIFQNFFLSLVSKPIPRNVKNIKSYLYRAICNDIVDTQRQVERYNAQIHKYQERCNFSINKTEPENALIKDEQMNKMFGLIKGRLTSSQSQAIALRYGTNHTIEEVAEKMGVKCKSVSRYICTGLRRMRQSFK
ncbi:MAG: sigma-70 family RNA polymerase sigma factor [Planctomycetes bacterium]|nr:sigma-70 family RNA polymerase sigma factor [Planctomycetota bacterium]MBL7145211.1 sigma-70 family RNA polymerase sigma factor [Phycisphaerae bacterium]